jgi:hypothetical protein
MLLAARPLAANPIASAGGVPSVNGNASGSFVTITVTTQSGSATGSASFASTLAFVPIVSLAGSASVNIVASGLLSTVSITSPSSSATGGSLASPSFSTVSTSTPSSIATGEASIAANFLTVSVASQSGSAIASAQAVGLLSQIGVVSQSAFASAYVLASGPLATVSSATQSGSATGSGQALASLSSVQSDENSSAIGDSALGDFTPGDYLDPLNSQTVKLLVLDGAASSGASASGLAGTVSLIAASGLATGDASVTVLVRGGGSVLGESALGDFTPGDYLDPLNSQTVYVLVTNGSATVSAVAYSESLPTVPVLFIGRGSGSVLGESALGYFTPGDNFNSGASAVGTAVANSDMTFVAIVHQDGSAKAFNPPGKAIAWTSRITHAGPAGKAIAWDGPLTRATARVVRTRAAAKYLEPVG